MIDARKIGYSLLSAILSRNVFIQQLTDRFQCLVASSGKFLLCTSPSPYLKVPKGHYSESDSSWCFQRQGRSRWKPHFYSCCHIWQLSDFKPLLLVSLPSVSFRRQQGAPPHSLLHDCLVPAQGASLGPSVPSTKAITPTDCKIARKKMQNPQRWAKSAQACKVTTTIVE